MNTLTIIAVIAAVILVAFVLDAAWDRWTMR